MDDLDLKALEDEIMNMKDETSKAPKEPPKPSAYGKAAATVTVRIQQRAGHFLGRDSEAPHE